VSFFRPPFVALTGLRKKKSSQAHAFFFLRIFIFFPLVSAGEGREGLIRLGEEDYRTNENYQSTDQGFGSIQPYSIQDDDDYHGGRIRL
jgi:hypothetical protein